MTRAVRDLLVVLAHDLEAARAYADALSGLFVPEDVRVDRVLGDDPHTDALALGGAIDSARIHLRPLAGDSSRAFACARTLDRTLADASRHTGQLRDLLSPSLRSSDKPAEQQVRSARVASRLVDAAVWVLPVRHQGRYRDEYRSELHELATAGTPSARSHPPGAGHGRHPMGVEEVKAELWLQSHVTGGPVTGCRASVRDDRSASPCRTP